VYEEMKIPEAYSEFNLPVEKTKYTRKNIINYCLQIDQIYLDVKDKYDTFAT
jgi:hypothetical protein